MKAIIETGGKQYYVEPGSEIYIEKLDNEAGSEVVFDKVLMVNGVAGKPYLTNVVVKGEVVRIADFGAFVDINGIDGLLPISEISWQRIKHPSDVITLGDTIEVKIIKIDTELKRISLSLKRMGENPWQQIEGQFEEGQIVKGTVNKVTTFGAFINIFPGVEALLPVSEMSDENVNPFNMFKVGSEVDVLIKKFTPKEHRIALSVKDIQK